MIYNYIKNALVIMYIYIISNVIIHDRIDDTNRHREFDRELSSIRITILRTRRDRKQFRITRPDIR